MDLTENKKRLIILLFAGILLFWQSFSGLPPLNTDAKVHLVESWYYSEYISRYHSLPAWADFWYGGFPVSLTIFMPYLAVAVLADLLPFFSVTLWYNLVLAGSVIASSMLIYLIAKEYELSDNAALFGALLFMVNPRVLYSMGAWGHFTTLFAFVPLLLTVYFTRKGRAALAAIALAVLFMSHLEAAVVGGYFILASFASEIADKRHRQAIVPVLVGLFGFLLAAFWFIPVLKHILLGGVHNLEGLREPIAPLNLFFFHNSGEWPGVGIVLSVLGISGLVFALMKKKMRDIAFLALVILFVGTTFGYVLLNNPLTAFLFKFLFNHPMPERHILFLTIPLSLLSAFALDVAMKNKLVISAGGQKLDSAKILFLLLAFATVGSAYYLAGTYSGLSDSFILSGGQREVLDYFKDRPSKVFVGEGFNAAGDFDRFFPMYTRSTVFHGFSPEFTLNLPYIMELYNRNYVQFAYAGGAEYFVLNKNGTKTMVPYYEIFQGVLKENPGEFISVLENKEYAVYKVKTPVPFVSSDKPVNYTILRPGLIELDISNCTGRYNLTILETFSPEWQSSEGRLSQTPLFFISLTGECKGPSEGITLELVHGYYYSVTAVGILLLLAYALYAEKKILGSQASESAGYDDVYKPQE